MGDIQGVDVSWLHRSTNRDLKSKLKQNQATAVTSSPVAASSPLRSKESPVSSQPSSRAASPSLPRPSQPTDVPAPKNSTRKQGLLGKSSSSGTTPEDSKGSKRSSWMSSISSRFSSSTTPPNQLSGSLPSSDDNGISKTNFSNGSATALASNTTKTSSLTDLSSSLIRRLSTEEDGEPFVSPSSKTSGSFLSSALRRLSNNSNASGPVKLANGNISCPRMVLNVDHGRDRTPIKDLEQSRLRRVAFSVDVEIAGGTKSSSDDTSAEKKKKHKDKKLKEKSEGEALKHPEVAEQEKGKVDAGIVGWDDLDHDLGNPPEELMATTTEIQRAAALEEKKKAKEEKKRKKAEAAALVAKEAEQVPQNQNDDLTPVTTLSPTNTLISQTSHHVDKPTTDPLRIYRRCCALREAPVLKRIKEQLEKPINASEEGRGTVTCLDLTGSRMQLNDIVCLGDWLALVAVKSIILENSNLTDDGVRIILSALLAAKTPDLVKRKRAKSSPTQARAPKIQRCHGFISKVFLKNNPKITREGWKHIALFINMSKSLTIIDLSMIPFPADTAADAIDQSPQDDIPDLMAKCITERLGGETLEELSLNECNLSTRAIRKITSALVSVRLDRLGLAGNHITREGLEFIGRYIQSGVCRGLDLSGNDLHDHCSVLAHSISQQQSILILSLADCNLDPGSMNVLMPTLSSLRDLRFIDFSHNPDLFAKEPTALPVFRRYFPKFHVLKRIHLIDVSMTPAQAIALAEILPEIRNILHLSIKGNPRLTSLASATDADAQEEACALYASFMAAARVSKTIINIEIDVPTKQTSEIIRALAKQVVAYCLRNLGVFTSRGGLQITDFASVLPDDMEYEKEVEVPEVLLHMLGGQVGTHGEAPQGQDYMVGSAGVIKALSYCLGHKAMDLHRSSSAHGTMSPKLAESEAGKAKDMSKHLLENARSLQAGLKPALAGLADLDEMQRIRLKFLDDTIGTMIERFENEYPDTRKRAVSKASVTQPTESEAIDTSSYAPDALLDINDQFAVRTPMVDDMVLNMDPSSLAKARSNSISARRGSETNLANRALSIEEGSMHRLGQRVRRDVLRSNGIDDHLHGTSRHDAPEAEDLAALRHKLEEITGPEFRDKVSELGLEATFKEVAEDAAALRLLKNESPDDFRKFRQAQLYAQANQHPEPGKSLNNADDSQNSAVED